MLATLPKPGGQGKGQIAGAPEVRIPTTPTPEEIADLIRASFPLTPVPSIPEIQLHKATPQSGLWRFAEADRAFDSPYWAYHWGGGLALARYVLDHPETVAGKTVLDLGAGSGLVAIAAALSGAAHVTAVDIDRYAIAATTLNATANSVAVATLHEDLTTGPPPQADIILAGDLFYDEALARRVIAFLDRCLAAGITILVGDPWRAPLPRDRLRLIAEFPGLDFGSGSSAEPKTNAVFAFRLD